MASDRFDYAGISYAPLPTLTASYYYARLADNYRQHYLNLLYRWSLTERLTLKTDLRYFDSQAAGHTTVDNRNLGGLVTLVYGGHALGVDYQRQSGRTGMPFIGGGTDPFTLNTLIVFGATLALAACGGGGGDQVNTPPVQPSPM